MSAKYGVVVFPGSNCDHDAYYALKKIIGADAEFLWHKDGDLKNCDAIILPGGFSYGDYLRSGAIAKLSPIMKEVYDFAMKGGPVLGICNGFQILTEIGLLPGVLLKNNSLQFICRDVYIKTVNTNTIFTGGIDDGTVLKVPIAHGDGNFFAEEDELRRLIDNNQIVFQYSSPDGEVDEQFNPNGSKLNIAGIVNENGNVLGMMPHPERASDPVLGKEDGAQIFKALEGFFIKQ